MQGMLNDGIESQGDAKRSYDKYGKRMWTATAKEDKSTKLKKLSTPNVAAQMGVDSNTKRSKTF